MVASDFVMDWRLIDCLRNGLALDQDVYDAAAWSSISILSQNSAGKRSKTMDIPDFTRGSWKNNKPVDLTLSQGATTQVRDVKNPGIKNVINSFTVIIIKNWTPLILSN